MKRGQIILIGILFLSLLANAYFMLKGSDVKETVKYYETIKIDTIRDTIPQPIAVYKLRTKLDTMVVDRIVTKNDTIIKAVVQVPYVQKVYAKDSVYKAWVSGYNPNLDSIRIYQMTKEIQEIRILKDKRKWSLGPAIFGGYDINNRNFGYGVGVSVQYNLIKW